ncbi:MAG: hypothetical protein Kow0089_24640 [Desulfobulbaceae bacterium]
MHFLRTRLPFLTAFFLVTIMASFACAQNLQAVKKRMLDRKPTIEALKNKGAVGEGNDGYLHVRKAVGNAQAIVNQENADRKTVYEAIARQQGVSAQVVGQRRALKIAEIEPPGHWLQKPDGSWYKK